MRFNIAILCKCCSWLQPFSVKEQFNKFFTTSLPWLIKFMEKLPTKWNRNLLTKVAGSCLCFKLTNRAIKWVPGVRWYCVEFDLCILISLLVSNSCICAWLACRHIIVILWKFRYVRRQELHSCSYVLLFITILIFIHAIFLIYSKFFAPIGSYFVV